MQSTVIEEIKNALAEQFKKTVRVSKVQMNRYEFKVNCECLVHSDLYFLHGLMHENACNVEVKRSGAGLLIIVIY